MATSNLILIDGQTDSGPADPVAIDALDHGDKVGFQVNGSFDGGAVAVEISQDGGVTYGVAHTFSDTNSYLVLDVFGTHIRGAVYGVAAASADITLRAMGANIGTTRVESGP